MHLIENVYNVPAKFVGQPAGRRLFSLVALLPTEVDPKNGTA
jgi:hypothetical protein